MATPFDRTGYDSEEYVRDENKGKLQVEEKEKERRKEEEIRSRRKSSRVWAALRNKLEVTRIAIEEQQKNIIAARDELQKDKEDTRNMEWRIAAYHGEWRKVGGTILDWLRSLKQDRS